MPGERIAVRVSPGGSRSRWMGRLADGRLKVRVGAPPEGGRANRELIRFVAESLGVTTRAVRVVAGAAARDKVLECDADPERVQRLGDGGTSERPGSTPAPTPSRQGKERRPRR